jgi:hypothetical protein
MPGNYRKCMCFERIGFHRRSPSYLMIISTARVRLYKKTTSDAPIELFSSDWTTIYGSDLHTTISSSVDGLAASTSHNVSPFDSFNNDEKKRHPEIKLDVRDGLPFSIRIAHDLKETLPGCVHTSMAELAWKLEICVTGKASSTTTRWSSNSTSNANTASHTEALEIHLTPCKPYHEEGQYDTNGLRAVRQAVEIDGTDSGIPAGKACKLLLSVRETSNAESMAVGVEIASGIEMLDPDSIRWLRGLRRVRLEWWRRIQVPATMSSNRDQSMPPQSTDLHTHEALTLLHRSGKLCRYSSDPAKPIRLIFELPPLRNVLSNSHVTTSEGNTTCGDVTQSAGDVSTDFFIRAIIESRGGAQPVYVAQATASSSSQPLLALSERSSMVIDHAVRVTPPDWAQLLPYVTTAHDQGIDGDGINIPDGIIPNESEVAETIDTRLSAYRLKGRDTVGQTGTFRAEGTSSSVEPPHFDTTADSSERQEPPPFSDAEQHGSEVLPSFDESERQRRATNRFEPSSLGNRPDILSVTLTTGGSGYSSRPQPAILTGQLGVWREYDGYETFSEPPPAASVSLGLSGSMDPPNAYDHPVDVDVSTAVGPELIERLGLGEGTRVIDTQEDMPPGFDEPSLPSLPNAIMPHHVRNIQRRGSRQNLQASLTSDSPPPPAFTPNESDGSHRTTIERDVDRSGVLPPPSFAASEAAEARGIAATGPEPLLHSMVDLPRTDHDAPPPPHPDHSTSVEESSAPPVYTTGRLTSEPEAPPGYS